MYCPPVVKNLRGIGIIKLGQTRVTAKNIKSLVTKPYPIQTHKTTPESILPFRVCFMPIEFTSYGPGNPAPIGIAIIGLNNYIL